MADINQKNYSNRFVNPYNFIHLPEKKAMAYGETDRHTGVIHYTITTKTPLFVPNSSSETAFKESDDTPDHKSYDFFSYTELDGKKRYEGKENYHVPVIPGSEMRGVVRNVYETLTDSCMGLLNEATYPVKRSPARFEHGLIYRDAERNYHLYKASSQAEGTSDNPQYEMPPAGYEKKHNGDMIKDAYLLKWGMGGAGKKKKKHYHLLSPQSEIKSVVLTHDMIKSKLSAIVSSYLDQPELKKKSKEKNKIAYEEYLEDLERFLASDSEGYFPVTYSMLRPDDQNVYLAPANYSKEISQYNLGILSGEFAPCKNVYCPACDLFGHVGETGQGSKIRFSDLYVEEKKDAVDYYACDKITLEALGEPKLGNTDFYLTKPAGNATFWTYDYYVCGNRLKVAMGQIRGRKYYWHHQKVNMFKVKPDRLNKTIRPVRKGITFTGELYFEGISEKQLKQLVWIMNSGTEKLGLKLGGAKPLGYGSISCRVNSVEERTISIESNQLVYKLESKEYNAVNYENAEFSTTVKEEFYKIADLESISEDIEITYPKEIVQKNQAIEKGYQWFVGNHKNPKIGFPKKREDAYIVAALPGILDKDITMKYSESAYKDSKYNNKDGKGINMQRGSNQKCRNNDGNRRPSGKKHY